MKRSVDIARARTLSSESTLGTPYRCCNLFDVCSDNAVLSLSLQSADPFLDWLGWQATDVCLIKKNFINWVRPTYSGATRSAGYQSDPCATPNSVSYGVCDFTLTDFGRLRRAGPTRDVTETYERYCENEPRYRIDGSLITNVREWDLRVIGEVLLQDLRELVVDGNASTGGQWDGLENLVKTGYTNANGQTCPLMDSIVINWNGQDMDGGAGTTWNGVDMADTFDLVDVLLAAYRQIRQRISWSPSLAAAPLRTGDIVIVLPTHLARCLLDKFTCWSVCPGKAYNESNLNIYEARIFRDRLLGGMFNVGRIYLDGFEVPLIAYDWGLLNGGNSGDIYMLTNQIGGVRLINGQYLDMTQVPGAYPNSGYGVTDGGRFLTWTETDETCIEEVLEFRPRMLMWAPWAQVRIQDVNCSGPGPVLSPDPASSYLAGMDPEDDFYAATCP